MLLIDAANVIGSRATGWWRDRAGAALRFVDQLRQAARQGSIPLPAVVVLEGQARAGVAASDVDGVRVVHAERSGDDALVAQLPAPAREVLVVTADRGLQQRVRALGAETASPRWLTEVLGGGSAQTTRLEGPRRRR